MHLASLNLISASCRAHGARRRLAKVRNLGNEVGQQQNPVSSTCARELMGNGAALICTCARRIKAGVCEQEAASDRSRRYHSRSAFRLESHVIGQPGSLISLGRRPGLGWLERPCGFDRPRPWPHVAESARLRRAIPPSPPPDVELRSCGRHPSPAAWKRRVQQVRPSQRRPRPPHCPELRQRSRAALHPSLHLRLHLRSLHCTTHTRHLTDRVRRSFRCIDRHSLLPSSG